MTWWHKKDFYRHKTYRTFHRRCHQECRQINDKRLPGKPRSPHCQKRDSPRGPSAGSTWSAFGRDSNPAFERQGCFRTNRFSLSLKSLEVIFHFVKNRFAEFKFRTKILNLMIFRNIKWPNVIRIDQTIRKKRPKPIKYSIKSNILQQYGGCLVYLIQIIIKNRNNVV